MNYMIKLLGVEIAGRRIKMAKKITSKTPLFGNRRSHACNATKHAQKPNLQKVALDGGQTIRMSAREYRTLKKITNVNSDIEA